MGPPSDNWGTRFQKGPHWFSTCSEPLRHDEPKHIYFSLQIYPKTKFSVWSRWRVGSRHVLLATLFPFQRPSAMSKSHVGEPAGSNLILKLHSQSDVLSFISLGMPFVSITISPLGGISNNRSLWIDFSDLGNISLCYLLISTSFRQIHHVNQIYWFRKHMTDYVTGPLLKDAISCSNRLQCAVLSGHTNFYPTTRNR
jgi:hypothetical protein